MSQIQLDLFSNEETVETKTNSQTYSSNPTLLSVPLQNAVLSLLQIGIQSSRDICERLIDSHNAPKERYSTEKPKIYPYVCLYLDNLVDTGELQLVSVEHEDRIYKIL